jgi:hypothetical protein
MRKFLIPLAAAASTVALAAPASAQFYPQQQPYGYNQYGYNPYGNQYGYSPYGQNHYRQNLGYARAMKFRLDRIQRDLRHLANYRMISRNEFYNRTAESRDIERRLIRNARDGRGLSPQEAYAVERRIARLEQRIARDVRDGRRYAYRWN